MNEQIKKYIFVVTIGAILVFSWFWNEGFGIAPKYQYGENVEQALNFWYERGLSNTGLSKVLHIEDITNNEKLAFYQSNTNDLWCGLVKKKWNNKWVVIEQGGGIPLFLQSGTNSNENDVLTWEWHNMKEFGLTLGIINNFNVSKINVGNQNAIILNTDNKNIWYFIDKNGSSYLDNKPNLDIKAFDKAGNLVYSYLHQK